MSSGVVNTITSNTITYLLASTAFAVCNTAANQSAKVATIYDPKNINAPARFTLMNGLTVQILFRYSNTANNNVTLNINATGALPLCLNAKTIPDRPGIKPTDSWPAQSIVSVTCYDTGSENFIWLINDANAESALTNSAGSGQIIAPQGEDYKIYIVGASQQNAEGAYTYSDEDVYIQNGELYSNDSKVITEANSVYTTISSADYLNLEVESASSGSILDLTDSSNSYLPTSKIVADTISYYINKVEQNPIDDVTEVNPDPEENGYYHGILLANDSDDTTEEEAVYKSVDLKYNPNVKQIQLTGDDSDSSSFRQVNINSENINFNAGIITTTIVNNEEENDYDDFQGSGEYGYNGLTITGAFDQTDEIVPITTITANSAILGGTLQINKNFTFNNTSNTTSILNGPLSLSNGQVIFNGQDTRFTSNGVYPLLIGSYTNKQNTTLNGMGYGLTFTTSTYQSAWVSDNFYLQQYYNQGTHRHYRTDLGSTHISSILYNDDAYDSMTNRTYITPAQIRVQSGFNLKQNDSDSQTDSARSTLTSSQLKFTQNNSTNYIVSPTQITNWNNVYTDFNTTPSRVTSFASWGTSNSTYIDTVQSFRFARYGKINSIFIRFKTINDTSLFPENNTGLLLFTPLSQYLHTATFYCSLYDYNSSSRPSTISQDGVVYFSGDSGEKLGCLCGAGLKANKVYVVSCTYISTQ